MENSIDPTSFKRPVSVLVVVYTRAGEVLLIRRKMPSDYWQSVTGSLEWGEQAEQAAQRELLEETGLDAGEALDETGVINTFTIYPEWKKRYAPGITENTEHVFTLCLPEKPEITLNPDEHTEYCWLDIQQAAAKANSETNRKAIQSLLMLNPV